MIIDGVIFEFMNTPFAEAPAELMFYLPQMKAFYAAEEANATLHNLYTLRGAQVRDAKLWSKYLHDARDSVAPGTEVLFGGHHWPRWGYDNITDYLRKQGDTYKYIHDQTLRLANHGFTMTEIAEMIELPGEPCKIVVQSRLLRQRESQRQSGLPEIPWMVRRQSRKYSSATDRINCRKICRVHGRIGSRARESASSVCGSRLPLGC